MSSPLHLPEASPFLLALGLASCVFAAPPENTKALNIPAIPPELSQKLFAYQNFRYALFQDWLADGRGLLLTTRFAETEQVHFVNTPGAARNQLTFFSEPVTDVTVCPDPKREVFLYTKDSAGTEDFQIYAYDFKNGQSFRLTDGISVNEGMLWSPKGDRFAFSSTRRNGRDFDIYICDSSDPSSVRLALECKGSWSAEDWSPDGRKLLIGEEISRTESKCYLFDIASKTVKALLNAPGMVNESAHFDATSEGVFFVSDDSSDFRRVRHVDLSTGKSRVLTQDLPWDVIGISLSPDRKTGLFVTNEHGFTGLYLLDAKTLKHRRIESIGHAIVKNARFSRDGKRLGFSLEKPDRPADVYSLDIATGKLTRWTFSETGGMDTSGFVAAQLVTCPTFDSAAGARRIIPALYYQPAGNGPFPVLISIHGGPESQFWPEFSPEIQFDVRELGIAVIGPNVRGSNGYGKSYLLLDNGYKREDAVRDIGACIDWIATRPELDSSRIAVRGGSYGGYMSLASMIRYREKLRAGIDIVGISNFITFLKTTKGYRQDLRRVEYGDERDPQMRKFLAEISPITNADRITKPLLIIHGANDPRVPAEEAEQIVSAIQRRKGTVWYLLAQDEGHGFRKKQQKDYERAVSALFLRMFLVGGP
jgi:Tol biopolymer transport system component/dienelactone hydrolase